MIAEIITIGSELLLGQVRDTNFMYLSQKLTGIGIEVRYRTTIGDDLDRLREALGHALTRAELVVTAGGLGPAHNDLTRRGVAEVTGKDLIFRQDLMDQIQVFFRRLRRDTTEYDRRQAYIPEGSLPIANPIGTAPGFILKHEGKAIVCLSGLPAEVQYMVSSALLPFLMERSGRNTVVFSRTLKLTGVSETLIEREFYNLVRDVANPSVGIISYPGEIHICLTARGETRPEAESYLGEIEELLEEKFSPFIFGRDEQTLESVVAAALRARTMTVALHEIYTAGRIAQRLLETDPSVLIEARISGAGTSNGNGNETADRLAVQMADRIRRATRASTGLATIAETVPGLPNTTLWVAISGKASAAITTLLLAQSPEVNKRQAVQFALDQLRRFINADSSPPPRK